MAEVPNRAFTVKKHVQGTAIAMPSTTVNNEDYAVINWLTEIGDIRYRCGRDEDGKFYVELHNPQEDSWHRVVWPNILVSLDSAHISAYENTDQLYKEWVAVSEERVEL